MFNNPNSYEEVKSLISEDEYKKIYGGSNRLISEQAVLSAIGEWIAHREYDYTNATEYLRNRIKAIPSAEPKWIPCSERLPEEGLDVLACFYSGEGNYKMLVSCRSDYNYWSGVGRTADMVAWMPLPSPYKGEK